MKNLKKISFTIMISCLLVNVVPASAFFTVGLHGLYATITGLLVAREENKGIPLFFLGDQKSDGYYTSKGDCGVRRLLFVNLNSDAKKCDVFERFMVFERVIMTGSEVDRLKETAKSPSWLNTFRSFNKTENCFDGLPITVSECSNDTFSESCKVAPVKFDSLGSYHLQQSLDEEYEKPTQEDIAELDNALKKGVKPHQLTNVFFDTTETARELSSMVTCFSDKGYCVVGSDKKNDNDLLRHEYENIVRERAKKALSEKK